MPSPTASVRLPVLHLSVAVFACLWLGFHGVGFAERSIAKSAVGTQKRTIGDTSKGSLKVAKTQPGVHRVSATKKITSQSASRSVVADPVRQGTATKIVPPKQFQKTTKTPATVSKTVSPKVALPKNQTVALKGTTAKPVAKIPATGAATASPKASVQKSVLPKTKAQVPSKISSAKISPKTVSQATPQKQVSSKAHPTQSVAQPKAAVPGAAVGVRAVPASVPKALPAFATDASVCLADVAKQLRLKYSANGSYIVLSEGKHCFEFQSGTREAKFDGIKVVLSFPIEKQSVPMTRFKKLVRYLGLSAEEYRIHTADVETVVKPLLFPQNFIKKRAKTIVIDPGHGGKAEGTVQNGLKEKLLTLKTAQLLAGKLRSTGYTVYLTRTADVDVSLSQRSEFANMKHSDLFISVHYNSAPSEQARGIEVFAFPPTGCPSSDRNVAKEFVSMPIHAFDGQNSLLGWRVQEKIIRNTGSVDRGVKRKCLAVLRELNCPGILVECGFLSHPTESKACNDADYQEKLTRAIADGIRAYNGN